MPDYKNLKFKYNIPYNITLKYDQPVEKDGQFGTFWIYGVKYQGEDYSFSASFGLHQELSKFKTGDILEILKVDDGDKKSHFEVSLQGGVVAEKQEKSFKEKSFREKTINGGLTRDIHRQVATKLAVQILIADKKTDYRDNLYEAELDFVTELLIRNIEKKVEEEQSENLPF